VRDELSTGIGMADWGPIRYTSSSRSTPVE